MDLRNLISANVSDTPLKNGTNEASKKLMKSQDNIPLTENEKLGQIHPLNKSQSRLSIHDLMNNDETPASNPYLKPLERENSGKAPLTPLKTNISSSPTSSITGIQMQASTHETREPQQRNMEINSSPKTPGHDIRRRSSISIITNDEDVDMLGNKTPNAALRHSTSTNKTNTSNTDFSNKEQDAKSKIDVTNGLKKRKLKTTRGRPKKKLKKTEKKEKKKSMTVGDREDGKETKSTADIEAHNAIQEEIQNLEELKHEEETEEHKQNKPRRYEEKPTWAKDYIPKLLLQEQKKHQSFANPTKLTVPSITGSIPRNDFNKLVTEWIWANVEGIKHEFSDVPHVENFIELELKLGNIWDKVKDQRIQLPVNTESVVNMDYIHQNCFFQGGMPQKSFKDIKEFLQGLVKDGQTGRRKDKFIIETSHNVDLIASEKRRNDKLVTGRVTLDVKTKRRVASIDKQRVSDLFIYMPGTLFDLRLSMSLELPHEMNDAAFENFKRRVTLTRDKDRVSYIHQSTATRLDLTKVVENETTRYELELEMNTPELLRSMSIISDDPLYYVDLVQAFLDNGRIISRQLSVQH